MLQKWGPERLVAERGGKLGWNGLGRRIHRPDAMKCAMKCAMKAVLRDLRGRQSEELL
jgi:hypothetical protein